MSKTQLLSTFILHIFLFRSQKSQNGSKYFIIYYFYWKNVDYIFVESSRKETEALIDEMDETSYI